MKANYRIINALIINEGKRVKGEVLLKDGRFERIIDYANVSFDGNESDYVTINAEEKILIPGVIDDQVHFRDPGLTHKGDLYTESKAAVAGGITSYMEMPNTMPQALTQEILEKKYQKASEVSLANYSFYMGASNDNIDEIVKTDPNNVCGIKVFMGASTGNMLVDNPVALRQIFAKSNLLVAVHCEDESTIRENSAQFKEKYGEDIPVRYHPEIRSREACLKSSGLAVDLAKKYNTRLHILHISTEDELALFDNQKSLEQKRITSEVCIHHLWFSDQDYKARGTKIKWNPAIKTERDRDALFQGMLDNKLDVIATDHAPHTIEEKQNTYFKAPSGGPLVQHSLTTMLEFYHQGKISLEKIVEKMCHAPAVCFQLEERGFIREGYWADFVLLDLDSEWQVEKDNILYKCGWSPFEGIAFHSKVSHTFVNGNPVYNNGEFHEENKGKRLTFKR
ncbi:MAG: dihydroorotase [Bacteroidales bacterium]|nr:dihydroorotase [Bacteroidales bacterium]MCF8386472.1 dihydroorotase [Bacteroidales bacterium]MCF8399412.1 dihydroorotase [Bacteroidales bacterium]